jgi:radical SAM superfamily enzyme YgiQ (UPF0313 family)
MPVNVLLLSTYELGHQPFGLASPKKWLEQEGAVVRCVDLAVENLPDDYVRAADLVACYVPMHTATRLAVPVARRVRKLNPAAHLCFYGLYAPMNADFLRSIGGSTILGGEFEEGLVSLARRLSVPESRRDTGAPQQEPVVSIARQQFLVPDRDGLPALSKYAHLLRGGERRRVGYTEATRGCKHLCRHCPIVPVYGGRFRVVQRDVVLADIANLVKAGAEHITFGDPDFFNGPRHAIEVTTAMHKQFPELTYDVVIKIEHLVKNAELLPALAQTQCVLVTSAVESFDDHVLTILDKRHTKDDAARAVTSLRSLGIAVNPTFVAFTPWTTLDSYLDFLSTIREFDLIDSVAPIQYAIRLLLPRNSRLLELAETQEVIHEFDEAALCYRWSHPDPRMDKLQDDISGYLQVAQANSSRRQIFAGVLGRATRTAGRLAEMPLLDDHAVTQEVPRLDEPWYCCAEPTEDQLLRIETNS